MSPYSPITLPETTEGKELEDFTIDQEPFDVIIDRLKGIREQLQVILQECSKEDLNG